MHKTHHSYVPGILLIAAGAWLMSRQSWLIYDIWQYLFPVLLLLLAAAVIINGRRTEKPSAFFWGTFLSLMSVYYFLENYSLAALPAGIEWPAVILSAGIAFLVSFFIRPNKVGLLLPGCLLTVWGGVDVLEAFHIHTFDYIDMLERYWPGLLIVFGLALILRSLFPGKDLPE
ncbi:hypothetical protein JXO52_08530 [bacterium]|nr:hypothetical protein [bacterium]